jgi:hypothetical protein
MIEFTSDDSLCAKIEGCADADEDDFDDDDAAFRLDEGTREPLEGRVDGLRTVRNWVMNSYGLRYENIQI